MVIRTTYIINVGGINVTSNFAAYLEKMKVTKSEKGSAHTASITLADPDGIIEMPGIGDKMSILAGSTFPSQIFKGTVNDVTSEGGKGQGRRLIIAASSADQKGKVKGQQHRHKDKAKLSDVAKEWGQKAGIKVQVIGEIGEIERDYWSIQRESFQSWGQRIAEEVGASFQIVDDEAILSPMNESTSVSGQAMTTVAATWGTNLISWKISPNMSRPQYGKITTTRFDRKAGEFKTTTETVDGITSEATLGILHTAPNEPEAKQKSKGQAKKSKRDKGAGTITILGDEAAEPGSPVVVAGAKAGIDGQYIAQSIEHEIDNDGFVTEITLRLPAVGK